MSAVKIPISAEFDTGNMDAMLAALNSRINQLGQSFAKVSGEHWNPISKTTLDDMTRMAEAFERIKKGAPNLAAGLQKSGQSNADYFDIDWEKAITNGLTRSATRYGAFRKIVDGVGDGGFSRAPTPAGTGQYGREIDPQNNNRAGGSGSGGGGSGGGGNSPGTTWGSASRKILGSGLRSMGGAGGAAAGAMDGMASGIAGPMILANLIAQGVGAIASAIKAKVGDAQQENIGYDTLKRSLGDVDVGFNELKVSLRNTAYGLGMTFAESQKVASAFAHASNMFGGPASRMLSDEVDFAGGFGRSFGMDPAKAASFFGQMRQVGVTSDTQSSKALGLQIGEALIKSRSTEKSEEFLSEIAGYAAQQSRMNYAAPNVSGYIAAMTGLVSSGTPGLDPSGAAGLLGRVNSSIAGGGSAGDAGRSFMYANIGQPLGLNPVETNIQLQGGAFATGKSTWGTDNPVTKFFNDNGLGISGKAAASTATNLDMILAAVRKNYGGSKERTELGLNAGGNLLGLNESSMAALFDYSKDPRKMSGLEGALSRGHFDFSKLDGSSISRIAQIQEGPGTQDEKDKKINQYASEHQLTTEGDQTRSAITGVSNAIQALADKTVPILNDMLTGITYMAGGGRLTPSQMASKLIDAQHDDRQGAIDSEHKNKIKAARDAAEPLQKAYAAAQAKWEPYIDDVKDPAKQKQARAAIASAKAALDAAQDTSGADADYQSQSDTESKRWVAEQAQANAAKGTAGTTSLKDQQWLKDYAAETDKIDNLPPGTSMAQFAVESNFNPAATSSAGAQGMAQVMPSNLKGPLLQALAKRLGRPINLYDPHDAALVQREMMGENMRHFGGNLPDALRGYDKGWKKADWNNPETQSYAPRVMGRTSEFGNTPLPDDGDTRAAAAKKDSGGVHKLEGNFTLTLPDGRPAAAPVQVQTQFTVPQMHGSRM